MRLIYLILALVSAVLVAGSAWWGSWELTRSVLLGALIGAANLYLLATIVRGMLGRGRMKKLRIGAAFLLKLALLFVIIGLLLHQGGVTPLPFLVGLSNILLTLLVVGAKGLVADSPEEGHP